MKKIITALVAVSMLATPAMANHRNGHDRGYERHERHNRGVKTGEAVALILGGAILGAAIAKNNRRTRVVEQYEYREVRRRPQYVCEDVVNYDYYGNPYVSGRNCWYQ